MSSLREPGGEKVEHRCDVCATVESLVLASANAALLAAQYPDVEPAARRLDAKLGLMLDVAQAIHEGRGRS